AHRDGGRLRDGRRQRHARRHGGLHPPAGRDAGHGHELAAGALPRLDRPAADERGISVSVQKSAGPAELEARRKVGLAGAALVRSGMVVGLGTGSTAAFAIEEIGRRVRDEKLAVTGVPTSWSAAELARKAGIDVRAVNDVAKLDLALDGADEVGPHLELIKGGGAAHTPE